MNHQTIRRAPILAGTTPRLALQILDEDGAGLLPDTLTMSVYDSAYQYELDKFTTWPPFAASPLVETIVNDREDVDVLANCDSSGNLELYLEAEDTDLTAPVGATPRYHYRRILFRWTYGGSPAKVGMHEYVLTIAANRQSLAS